MNFLKKISFPKSIIIFLSLLVFAGLFFPFLTSADLLADAVNAFNFITDIGDNLAEALLMVIFSLLMTIPLFILNVSLDLLTWVAGGNFLAISFTGPENIIVSTGWGFVRNLANVVLIFGLVIIALSIIVGYQETRAKKTLVNFILIAALINFTPVICGLIIDLAQMIMDLLLKGGVPPTFFNLLSQKISNFNGADLATLFVLTIFAIFASVIYLLFALLFLVRIVMLWVLVILSPIAFASKVLPESKYFLKIFPRICTWDGWWDDFLQWCFLGIPAAGAIFLSNLVMFHIASDSSQIINPPSGNVLNGTFGLLFAYLIPFIVLIVGFFTTLDSGGPMGAKIKGMANKTWAATGGAVAGAVAGAATGYARERAGAFGTWTREGVVGIVGGIAGGDVSKEGREKGRVAVIDWKQRQKERIAQNRVTGKLVSPTFATDKTKAQKDAEKYVSEHALSIEDYRKYKDRFTTQQRLAYEDGYIKKDTKKYLGDAGTTEEYDRRMKMILRNDDGSKEYKRIKTKAALDSKYKNKNLVAQNVNWDINLDVELKDEIKKMSSKDLIDDVSAEAYTDPEFISSLRSNQLDKIIKDGSGEITDSLYKILKDRKTKQQFRQYSTDLDDKIKNAKNNEERFDAIKEKANWTANFTLIGNKMRYYTRKNTGGGSGRTRTRTNP